MSSFASIISYSYVIVIMNSTINIVVNIKEKLKEEAIEKLELAKKLKIEERRVKKEQIEAEKKEREKQY